MQCDRVSCAVWIASVVQCDISGALYQLILVWIGSVGQCG